MYLMEVLNRVSEIQNLSSIGSDRDALADEIGSLELRLFCLLYGVTKTDTLTSLRYARCTVLGNDMLQAREWG